MQAPCAFTNRLSRLALTLLTVLLPAQAQAQFQPQFQTSPPAWSTFASLDDRPRSLVTQDLGRLILLRPRNLQDSGAPVDVWLDGRFHTTVLPGAFTETEVCPGPRRLDLAAHSGGQPGPRAGQTVSPQARQTLYLWVQTQSNVPVQTPLSAQQAQALLPDLRRQAHAVSRLLPARDCAPQQPAAPQPLLAQQRIQPPPVPAVMPALASPDPAPADPAPSQRYTLSAEMLFNFAGSKAQHLSEQGQTQIVRLGKRIKEQLRPGQIILVQGHTDPMGSAALNQRLSLERAQTVSRILANSGLPARQLRAEGLGSSELLVKDCQQAAKTREARLNCNRPNRRVEITVLPAKN